MIQPKLASTKSGNGKTLIWWMGPIPTEPNNTIPAGHDNFYTPTTWEPSSCQQQSTTH